MKISFNFFVFFFLNSACQFMACKDLTVPNAYPAVIEKLLYFKENKFRVFYGGPIEREGKGVSWMMPVTFEDDTHKTRAVYEIAFVNCDLHDAHDAEILFIDVADINIKLKNILSYDYPLFSWLLSGGYSDGKYIVVRCADVANVCYPDIFIASEYGEKKELDKECIVQFLHKNFKTSYRYHDFYDGGIIDKICFSDDSVTIYDPIRIGVVIDGIIQFFFVEKRIQKKDIWGVYYCIFKNNSSVFENNQLLRLDSGCVSGQLYDDCACDCLDQLHYGLKLLASDDCTDGMIIHIPGHDGRGFGTAPKAETEIYKRGGKGRIHETVGLDTICAARLLYGADDYDIRSFDGVGAILNAMNIDKVILLTDNIEKINALQKCGIEVIRQKTNTNKESCLKHINAKKESGLYIKE